jgi:hypothetical protein
LFFGFEARYRLKPRTIAKAITNSAPGDMTISLVVEVEFVEVFLSKWHAADQIENS